MSPKLVKTGSYFDSKEKIWRGPKEPMETRSGSSMGRSMLESLRKKPEHIAQIWDHNSQEYTNKDIELMSIRIAQHLEEIGLQQEDVIGICASNTEYIAPLVVGALLCGATLSTLEPSFDKNTLKHLLSITKPKLMFCDGKVYGKVETSLAELSLNIPIYTMKDHLKGVRQIQELLAVTEKEHLFNVKPLKLGLNQTAAILSSSGTTGLSKGVCLSHGSILSAKSIILSSEDKELCFANITWVSSIMILLRAILYGWTRVITDQEYSPQLFLRMVEQYKITVVFTAPSQMALAVQSPDLKRRDLSSLELYYSGGSPISLVAVRSFLEYAKNCKIFSTYGMSVLAGSCSIGTPNKAGENGNLVPNFEVKIIDELGNNLGVCERGEICIKQPFKWPGYYGNQEATDAIYDKDGWFYSGDIGYFDEQGSLFVVDRKQEILRYIQYYVYPTEIEKMIMYLPDVVEVSVCGIPDIISNFLPAAAIVKKSNSNLTEAEVFNYVAERMADYKKLRGGVYFLNSLPKTHSGKTIRFEVLKIVEPLFEERNKSLGVPLKTL